MPLPLKGGDRIGGLTDEGDDPVGLDAALLSSDVDASGAVARSLPTDGIVGISDPALRSGDDLTQNRLHPRALRSSVSTSESHRECGCGPDREPMAPDAAG
ncbi:MAG: hypothetical protein AB7H93_10915 [Vicinamibacterales bacterium]